jgi:uncharacterized protein YcfJ
MKPISISILALAVSVAAGSAFAYQQDNYASQPRTDTAQVIRVERMNDRYSDSGYQRQECWNEQTNGYESGYYRDSNGRLYRSGKDSNVNGTIIGALIGGALGNQVGKGDGRKAATIGGAVIGGAIGNSVDRNNDSYDQYRDDSGTIRRCRLVNDGGNDPRYGGGSGYNVTYRYAGQTYHAYTRRDPGRYIRVLVDVRPLEGGYRNR